MARMRTRQARGDPRGAEERDEFDPVQHHHCRHQRPTRVGQGRPRVNPTVKQPDPIGRGHGT